MKLSTGLRFVALALGVLTVIGLLAWYFNTQQEQLVCTGSVSVIVKPGQSIQRVINQVPEGATICLAQGTFVDFVNTININKSLKLQGLGRDRTFILRTNRRNNRGGPPIIHIASEGEIEVTIENLTVAGDIDLTATEDVGARCKPRDPRVISICRALINVGGRSRVTIQDTQISHNEAGGLVVGDLATVKINNSIIKDNRGFFSKSGGVAVDGLSSLSLTDSEISRNSGGGLSASGRAQVSVANSTIFGNVAGDGVSVSDWAKVIITNSRVSHNGIKDDVLSNGIYASNQAIVSFIDSEVSNSGGNGLSLSERAILNLVHSQVSNNGLHGLRISESAIAMVRQSTFEGNGTWQQCRAGKIRMICASISLRDEAQLKLIDSVIRNNEHWWGLAAIRRECGNREDHFTGQVIFEGKNVIEDNSKSGELKNKGNPGDHPWNRSEVPDGQVCLP